MDNPETRPAPMGNSNFRLKTGVETRREDREWSRRLVENLRGIDPEYQKEITGLVASLGKENPIKAREIARRLGDFFSGIGKAEHLSSFIERIKDEIEAERKKHIQ